jgi:hypothetical protein
VTETEKDWAAKSVAQSGKPASCVRKPGTLEKGIRGRPAKAASGAVYRLQKILSVRCPQVIYSPGRMSAGRGSFQVSRPALREIKRREFCSTKSNITAKLRSSNSSMAPLRGGLRGNGGGAYGRISKGSGKHGGLRTCGRDLPFRDARIPGATAADERSFPRIKRLSGLIRRFHGGHSAFGAPTTKRY